MPVTFTIKQIPDRLARRLREMAASNHRSLQGELMAILEAAAIQSAHTAGEPGPKPYVVERKRAARESKEPTTHGRKMTLAELWERSKRLGPASPDESVAIIRKLRDERYGR